MEVIASSTQSNVDISSLADVCQHTASKAMIFSLRLTLENVTGNAGYTVRFIINDTVVIPENQIRINDQTTAVFQSRGIWLEEGDSIAIQIAGTTEDTSVGISYVILDIAPPTAEEMAEDLSARVAASLGRVEVRPTVYVLSPLPRRVVSMPRIVR